MAWGGGAGQILGESAVRGGGEEVLGRHGDVVNSIREQRGGVAHRGGCSTAVGRRGSTRRGWPTVAGDWLLGREGVRRPGDARGGADVAGGGPVRAGAAEALGGSGAAPVALFGVSARQLGGWLGTLRWRRRPWRNCSGAQGAAVGLGRRRLISRTRRAEERGGTKRVERRGEVSDVELTADKGGRGRGRGWSAAHVEAVLHGRRVEVGGRWRGRAWRAQ
jgi:hypothetical protein